ncbi:MAG: nucleotidyltransferase domain-containing protein [Gammaproteobacteria bacterium]|nr:nucleotidyltransferase domain-containing protein [Gammaproteobacteria bacterium]
MVDSDSSPTSGAQAKTPGKDSISPAVWKQIKEKLNDIERENTVRILLAVESGSRAWGFPSPDSDYDVRFLYARPRDWYLSIGPRRDVIECPIVDMLDINGWDINKALGLLLKANPVLSEWLCSPIRYREDPACTKQLCALAARVAFARPSHFHYLHLGRSAYAKISDRESVATKKYFYAIRPALALRWLRTRSGPPPMDLPRLRDGLHLERELDEEIERLAVAKSESTELGIGSRIGEIDRFIEEEFALADIASLSNGAGTPDLLEDTNRLFREIVDEGS